MSEYSASMTTRTVSDVCDDQMHYSERVHVEVSDGFDDGAARIIIHFETVGDYDSTFVMPSPDGARLIASFLIEAADRVEGRKP